MTIGYIYVIGSMEHFNYVKIGISGIAPHKSRLAQLQTGNPFLLQIWGSFPVPKIHILKYEKFIHEKIKDNRRLGEWFEIKPQKALLIVDKLICEFTKREKNQ